MARGRKSAESLLIVVQPDASGDGPRINPPASLTATERVLFLETVRHHQHLGPGDSVMIAAYVAASVKFQRLSRGREDVRDWEKAGRMMLALARSLRLTQQSATDAKTLARARSKPDARAIMEEMDREARCEEDDDV
jgi:hypothetical protein